jgi:hypothetical protein
MANKKWANYRATFYLHTFGNPITITIREYNRHRAERLAIKEYINGGNDTNNVKRLSIGRAYEI